MTSPQIAQLQDQQFMLTQAVRAMLEGNWCGEASVQAWVAALDPSLQPGCVPPYRESDQPPPPPNFLVTYNPDTSQPGQLYDWTCSACSLDWLKRALGLVHPDDIYASRQQAVDEIGYPGNINETYGLMDGSGAQLQRVLADYGQNSDQGWLSYDSAWSIYSQVPGMMSGGSWYHWVGVRGTSDGNIWVANSAPGYMGVWDILSRDDFNRLGPFSCVWCMP